MSTGDNVLAVLAREVSAVLGFQGELGLTGLDVVPEATSESEVPSQRQAPSEVARVAQRATAIVPTAIVAAPKATAVGDAPESLATLDAVRREMGDCQRCKLHAGRTHIVFGVGSPTARLLFVGEGPGRDEDLQGVPFVGAAGQLLDRMVKAMGLSRGEVYIANIVKCRPPGNRDPEPDEIEACEGFLQAQIRAVRPSVIVALGRIAAQALLHDPTPVSRLRGVWREYEGVPLMPTFHPAYLLRTPGDKRLVWDDLQAVMQRLGLAAASKT